MFGLSHRYYRDNLNAYIDGQLSPRDRARLEHHLQQCPDCRWELETLQRTVALVRQMPAVRAPRSFQIPVQVPRATPWLLRPWVYGTARVATVAATLVFVVSLAGNVVAPQVGLRGAALSQDRGMVAAAATLPAAGGAQAKSAEGTPGQLAAPEQPPAPTAAPQLAATAAATGNEAFRSEATVTVAASGTKAAVAPSATLQPTRAATSTRVAPTATAAPKGGTVQPTLDLFGGLSQGETSGATPETRAQTAEVTATAAQTPVPAAVGTAGPEPTLPATVRPTARPTQTTAPAAAAKPTNAPTATPPATRVTDAAIAMAPGPAATSAGERNTDAGVNDSAGTLVAPATQGEPDGPIANAARLFAEATEEWPWQLLALASGSLLALLVVVLLYLKAMRARMN